MSAYYEIIFGTGFYWCDRYVVKADEPTTDYGALVDCLIDHLVEKKDNSILDWVGKYEWSDNGNGDNLVSVDDPTDIIYSDEFVVGGNCGDVLMHHGDFRINEISEADIGDAEIVEVD